MKESIIDEYDKNIKLLKSFTESLEISVREILKESGIQCTVASRTKERGSLIRKIEGKNDAYWKLGDITDIVGLRIITYFEDDVPAVCAILEGNLTIDEENSIDKGASLSVDQFWYRSVHKVVSLSEARAALYENKKFKGLKAEIQVRSVLQHAWAEMEHDIGYKSNLEVPADMRRKFSRLAGLLELADQEFVRIRHDLVDYDKEVKKWIKINPELIRLDKISLTEFLKSDETTKKIDTAIAKIRGGVVIPASDWYCDTLLKKLKHVGISDLGTLSKLVRTEEKIIIAFATKWLNREGRTGTWDFHSWVSLFYLCYVLIWRTKDVKQISDYFEENITRLSSGKNRQEVVQEVMDTMIHAEAAVNSN